MQCQTIGEILLYLYSLIYLDCEQSLFCSEIPAGGAARKRVRYRPRDFAVHPARILEQKRDCSQPIIYSFLATRHFHNFDYYQD